MTSRAIVPLEYVEQVSPWPRILKLLGMFTLLYGGMNLSMGLHFFKTLWVLRASSNGMLPREIWIMSGSSLLEILLGGTLMLGGVQALRHHSYRFIALGLWI